MYLLTHILDLPIWWKESYLRHFSKAIEQFPSTSPDGRATNFIANNTGEIPGQRKKRVK